MVCRYGLVLPQHGETTCEQLKALPTVQSTWDDVKKETARWSVMLGAEDYTVCLELCTETWEGKRRFACTHTLRSPQAIV